jgi:hypothetical protein
LLPTRDEQPQRVLGFVLRQRLDMAEQAFGGGGGDEREGHLLLIRPAVRDGTAASGALLAGANIKFLPVG